MKHLQMCVSHLDLGPSPVLSNKPYKTGDMNECYLRTLPDAKRFRDAGDAEKPEDQNSSHPPTAHCQATLRLASLLMRLRSREACKSDIGTKHSSRQTPGVPLR